MLSGVSRSLCPDAVLIIIVIVTYQIYHYPPSTVNFCHVFLLHLCMLKPQAKRDRQIDLVCNLHVPISYMLILCACASK